MQDNSDLIIRDCCEAEVAEFGQPDTICITVDVLREIVQRHFPGPCLHQIQEPAPVPAAQPAMTAALFAARGALQHLKEGGKPTESLLNEAIAAIDSVAISQAAPAAVAVPDERVAFEEWALRCAVNVMYCEPDNQYLKTSTELLWQCWKARAALAANPAAAPLPLLVRDIARELGITCPEACLALKPLGNFSTNTAVTAEMMAKLRERFPERVPASEVAGARERMTTGRACYFMERFLKEEKLLGPNEQAALHYVIDMLEAAAASVVLPEPVAYSLGLAKYAHSSNIIAANEFTPDAEHADEWENLYTEQQLRDVLATATGLPAQAVPAFCHVASLKLKSLQERGYQITGYALEKPVEGAQPERGFINHGGFVGWWWDGQSPMAQADARDAELLGFLQDQCIDLRCFTTSDGEDVGWRTVQHHMSEPRERVVSEVYGDQPRRAIREAMARIERDPYCTGPLHLEDDAAIAAAKGE